MGKTTNKTVILGMVIAAVFILGILTMDLAFADHPQQAGYRFTQFLQDLASHIPVTSVDIVDGTITSADIQQFTITRFDVSQQFIHVFSIPTIVCSGNIGWCPNGVKTFFNVPEERVTEFSTVIFTLFQDPVDTSLQCHLAGLRTDTGLNQFLIDCNKAVPFGTRLSYAIFNP